MAAIAAEHGCNIYKTDTKQAFLYSNLEEDENIYIKPPDWWFEPVPEEHVLQLLKAVHGTVQATCRWHTKISTWMEDNGYQAVNGEKTTFMKHDGKEFIMHWIFVNDMKQVPTAKYLLNEFLAFSGFRNHWRTSPYEEFHRARCRKISEKDISPS